MMHRLRPFQIGAMCVLLASCAVPKSGAVDEVSPSDIPFGLNSPETSSPSTTTTLVVQTTVAGTAYEKADLFFVENASLIRVSVKSHSVLAVNLSVSLAAVETLQELVFR